LSSAAAVVAADVPLERDARTLAIVGAGIQGEHQLRTLPLVREFDDLRVASLHREDAERSPRCIPTPARPAPKKPSAQRTSVALATPRRPARNRA
jgi:hypothetical protein